MSCKRNIWKVLALALSLACAVSLVGCQRQAQPSGGLTQPDSAVSPAGSEELTSSLTESGISQPLSSSDSGETSQPPSQEAEGAGSSQAVVSSSGQQASSEAASQPSSSQEAASESQTPSIPFTLVEYRRTHGDFFSSETNTRIITEPSGLEGCDTQNKERYDDAFFHDHALLYLKIIHANTGPRERVNRLIPSGQQLIVDYTVFHPMIVAEGSSANIILLEVSKSDLEGITQVVLQSNTIRWRYDGANPNAEPEEPEGWDPWEYTNSQSGAASS